MPRGQCPTSTPSTDETTGAIQRWPASHACHDPSMLSQSGAVTGPDPTFSLAPPGIAGAGLLCNGRFTRAPDDAESCRPHLAVQLLVLIDHRGVAEAAHRFGP